MRKETRQRLALELVKNERKRQDVKWGEQNHDPFLWMSVLGEEFGEACQAALRLRFNVRPDKRGWPARSQQLLTAYEAELVQVAAVAVAAMESLDRWKWKWGNHAEGPVKRAQS